MGCPLFMASYREPSPRVGLLAWGFQHSGTGGRIEKSQTVTTRRKAKKRRKTKQRIGKRNFKMPWESWHGMVELMIDL